MPLTDSAHEQQVINWLVEKHPLMLRNLYRALGGRFEDYAGLTKRRAGTQTVAVVGLARHAAALAAKIAGRLREAGERVSSMGAPGTAAPASHLNGEGDRSCQWRIIVVSADAWQTLDAGPLIGADAIIWAAEPGDSAAARQKWVETARLVRDLEAGSRLVWLLPAERPLAPPASDWKLPWIPRRSILSTSAELRSLPPRARRRLWRSCRDSKSELPNWNNVYELAVVSAWSALDVLNQPSGLGSRFLCRLNRGLARRG